ncbi:MAG TPA: 2-nitropropane dioxygenase [Thermoanaerobaculia bacterium]|nr:2-nitropropane dioxygenase [Thermoanaerobaculia bacterium]HUM31173.1 2-nitropropane dioxygenase [Thermoanaerobaculia bacterium]HXK69527.1 2-nitropropane dioxygenase [Thermoanaerobaculia bacterium]
MKIDKIHVTCPHCQARLTVDRETGDLLASEVSREKNKISLEDRLKALDSEKERSDEIFQQQMKALEDKDRLLEEKFKEAVKKSKESDPGKPIRDIDLD